MSVSVKDLLKKMAFYIERKKDPIFSVPIKNLLNYLDTFNEPVDLEERSYFQYKCQMKVYGTVLSALINAASFPLVIYYCLKKYKKPENMSSQDGVFFRDGKPDNILPKSLKSRYGKIISDPKEGMYLGTSDRAFLFNILKAYPLSWHFILKNIIKIARYSYVINEYSPSAIIVCAEYSFSSSILTKYCNEQGIEHINVMHGEKLLDIRDSFFQYNVCYVWDEYYIELFKKLRAGNNQFVVELPESMLFEIDDVVEKKYDYVYYLSNEDIETLKKIIDLMEHLSYKNRVAIRPHPRYTNIGDLLKVCGDKLEIEDNDIVSIENSILQTRNVIALFSTVLNQAYHNNVGVIIDDICNKEKYEKLKELEYLMLKKNYNLLSNILE